MAAPSSEFPSRSRAESHLLAFATILAILLISHLPYVSVPFFWDELGQFIPAALDLQRAGKLVPVSTVPNVHPPGVMAWLALVWDIFGYSVAVTRVAMLTLSAVGLYGAFVLAVRMCRDVPGAPALTVVLLLFATPLVYMQAMMAQLDFPAMVFSMVALVLFFDRRHILCAIACTLLVLSKETGAILPAIFAGWLVLRERNWRDAQFYALPFLALGGWLLLLKSTTGQWLGDPGFAQYNVNYSLSPVRSGIAIVRRLWFLFGADFRWIGTIAIVYAWRRTTLFRTREWSICGIFFAAHVLLVCFFGGATLERYLLPVFPLLYIAMATGLATIHRKRSVVVAGLLIGLVAGLYWDPPYPAPLENNLAMVDFVELQKAMAEYVEREWPNATIGTAWPYTGALYNPDVLYVHQRRKIVETNDFRLENVRNAVKVGHPEVLLVYSRTWEPPFDFLRFRWVDWLLETYYDYHPQITDEELESLGYRQQFRFRQRSQWMAVYAR